MCGQFSWLLIASHCIWLVAFLGHSQILSGSHSKKSGEDLVLLPHHRPEMVDTVVDMILYWWQSAHTTFGRGEPVLVIEPRRFAWTFYQQLQVSQVSSRLQTISRNRWKVLYTCALTERDQESSILRASASFGVKTSVCTQATSSKTKIQMVMLLVHVGICELQYVALSLCTRLI